MGRVKDMILFHCERCERSVLDGEVGFDGENNLCVVCVDEWTEKQIAYWRPLYGAEVRAGIHNPKGDNDA
jgi:hypothetical protein